MAATTNKASVWLLLLLCVYVPCSALVSRSTHKTFYQSSLAYTRAGSSRSNHSTFNQLIDHKNPSLGTFSQFYYYSDKYWAGPGSPIIVTTPGEVAVAKYDAWFHENTIFEAFAKALGAAVIIIEHRYYGHSSPYANLTAKTLQYMTLDNAIADLTNFAQNVKLPFDPKRTSPPSKAPWVLAGGSYAGALSAWTERLAEGTFWAFHASSAPVEAIYDFWQYFHVIETYMPRPCFDAVSKVVKYVDEVISIGDAKQIASLKSFFTLPDLSDNGDFASALSIPFTYLWQYDLTEFDQFCSFVETGSERYAGYPLGGIKKIPLTTALDRYARYMKYITRTFCSRFYFGHSLHEGSTECLRTDNSKSPIFTDTSVSNPANRQWIWMLCNEPFAWWPSTAPGNGPSIISRLVTAEYFQRQCSLFFPVVDGLTFGSANGKTVKNVNAHTGGWTTTSHTRLLFVNGQYDPWREAGVSSDFRPGGPLNTTSQAPIFIIPKGDHVPDLYLNGLSTNQKAIVDREVSQMKAWVAKYPKKGYTMAAKNGVGHVFDCRRSTSYALLLSLIMFMTLS